MLRSDATSRSRGKRGSSAGGQRKQHSASVWNQARSGRLHSCGKKIFLHSTRWKIQGMSFICLRPAFHNYPALAGRIMSNFWLSVLGKRWIPVWGADCLWFWRRRGWLRRAAASAAATFPGGGSRARTVMTRTRTTCRQGELMTWQILWIYFRRYPLYFSGLLNRAWRKGTYQVLWLRGDPTLYNFYLCWREHANFHYDSC